MASSRVRARRPSTSIATTRGAERAEPRARSLQLRAPQEELVFQTTDVRKWMTAGCVPRLSIRRAVRTSTIATSRARAWSSTARLAADRAADTAAHRAVPEHLVRAGDAHELTDLGEHRFGARSPDPRSGSRSSDRSSVAGRASPSSSPPGSRIPTPGRCFRPNRSAPLSGTRRADRVRGGYIERSAR